MSSLHFVVSIGEGDQLNDRIREVADKINKYGTQTFPALHSLKVPVKQVVVGNSYLGVLLADGRAFRVAYSVIAERLDLSKHDSSTKNNGAGAGNGNTNSGSTGGNGGSSTSKPAQASSRQLARSTRARIMRTSGSSVRGQTSRSTGVIIGGTTSGRSLVTVPATFVPEELISQAQVVLQGKSRSLIIRELQRTNLDVNLAVNNLLSRDDEEGEDTEEGSDNYVPEDLISLLDSGIHPDPSLLLDNDAMFSEDMRTFRNLMLSSRDRMQSSSAPSSNQNESGNVRSSGTSSSTSAVVSGSGSGTSASLTFGRLRDRTYFGPRRWFQSTRDEVQWEKEQETRNKLDTSSGFPLWISDDLEFWPDKDGARFIQIAALHSEFIAISTKGELHQWRWADREPYRNNELANIHHPKTQSLGLTYEKIVHISATTIRCSVVTESGKIANWMDEQLGYAGNKLEHQATSYPEFTLDKITSLHTCSLYTVARTESGELFWWGVLPFSQRKKMWEKYKAKSKKPQKKDKDKDQSSSSSSSEVTVGAQVCMKNSPMYQPGAIGFCISNGVPKVGQLLNAAWDLMNICRFKILPMPQSSLTSTSSNGSTSGVNLEVKEATVKIPSSIGITNTNSNSSGSTSSVGNKETADRLDMPPPPSPASSTCSDTSVSVKRKRITQKEDSDGKKDEEFWNLKDVVFVEDVRSVPVGRVLKVDGQFAAVRFPSNNTKDKFDESSIDAWQDCRLLRKDDLQIIKSTATSRVPDCIQKIPRRIVLNLQLNEHSQLLTLAIDSKGIHTIMKTGTTLHYSLFNLSGGRMGKSSNFPTDINSFMGKSSQNISLVCAGDQPESILILRDGNKTIYPLAKDCLEAVRDPLWMDLPPLSCVAATPVTIQSTNVNTKTQVTLVVMATEQQLLMPKIMRCDVDAIKYFLGQLNGELKSQVSAVVQEFADGNRNILHACVTQCSPTSNKDSDQDLNISNANNSSSNNSGPNVVLDCINAVANSMISRPSSSIRDLMRRSSSTSALAGDVHMSSSGVSVSSADDNSINLSYWPSEYEGGNSGDEDSLSGIHMQKVPPQNQSTEMYVSDPTERRLNALLSVQMICENSALQPHLRQLLSAKDSTGQTPFMLAVSSRAYQAGIVLFETILKIANGDAQIRDSMVFPNGCTPDQSPLHVICCNDTCSFTWTGADHINQDIFECQTCGLSGSLCCCTECAKVCHKGHDCKLKQTTPTAYCDCWQKCKCKALIAGNQTKRAELLEKLIKDTDLVMRFNSRGESILLFLIQTVGRQSIEQRQYRSARGQQRSSGSYLNRKTPSIDTEGEMPEHDLEPPRFARKALERLLGDWNSVRAMIQTGVENEINLNSKMTSQVFYEDSDSKSLYINSQSGTIMLDKFTHILFFRCTNEPLDALLSTLTNELRTGKVDEAQKVARRFVRSVARVFVIFSIEKSNNPDKQKNSTLQARLMQSYRRVFKSLLKFAIEELVEIADALIAPVRLGVVRPTAPFQLPSSSNNLDADDLFSVEPLAPASRQSSLQDAVTSRIDTEASDSGFLARISSALRNDLDDANDPDAMVHDDGDISEQDDSQSVIHARQHISNNNNNNNNNNVADEVVDDQMGQDGGHEAESDNEFNFQEAETESDSDDNQSTQDAGRSVQTGATAGSDTGLSNFVLINEDDTGDSSQPDEDGSEDADSDEQSTEEFVLDEQLERRTTSSGQQRSNAPPHSLHWAIRSRDTTRTTNLHRLAGASNLVFIDPSAIRRSTSASAVAAQEAPTMATTSSSLARAFGIVLRQISELVGTLAWKFTCPPSNNCDRTYQETVQLQMFVERRLKPTWDWILTVMDATEAQLRFGASLTDSTDSAHPLHPSNNNSTTATTSSSTNATTNTTTSNVGAPQRPNRTVTIQMLTPNLNTFNSGSRARDRTNGGTDNATSRRDFLTYCLSLMRAHNSEHRDSLPVLDVTALRHVAYVLDAIIFYMRASNELDCDRNDSNAWDDQDDNENDDVDDEFTTSLVIDTDSIDDSDMVRPSLGKRHGFFQRSESTLCLGCPAPDSFNTPMNEALPLADQPQLLQPNARREDLFGMPKQAITVPTGDQSGSSTLELPPIRLGLSSQNPSTASNTVVISCVNPTAQTESQSETIEETLITKQQMTMRTSHGGNKQKDQETISSLKRPHSPQPGPSNVRKHFEEYEDDDDSIEDEPQDLSQQTLDLRHTSNKMDVDNVPQIPPLKSSDNNNSYDDSDDSDNDSNSIRSPVHKKHRLMESTDIQPEQFALIPKSHDDQQQQQMNDQEVDPSVRPPIIVVTRRNVADAIEAVTATVLSKNKKTNLNDCVTPETPLSYLPNSFMYDGKSGSGEGTDHGSSSSTSKSSVIVRVGPSTSTTPIDNVMETIDENQEVSANVTIETTNTPIPPQLVQELPPRGVYFRSNITSDLLLGRWRLSLILFGRVFQEDVGMEPGSIISELGGFPVKEAKFRRHMEKLRNGQQRDLTLSKIDRARNCLIPQTFKELNTQYNNNNRRLQPPLAFNRVKVTFKDEPGEGSGVARSFYTLIAEALLSRENLPNLESAQVGSNKYNVPFTTMIRQRNASSSGGGGGGSGSQGSSVTIATNSPSNPPPRELSEPIRRITTKRTLWRYRDNRKVMLNYDSRPFRPQSEGGSNEHLSGHQQQLGERLYNKVLQIHPAQASKITGMLLDLPPTQWIMLLSSDETLRQKANEAMALITFRHRMDRESNNGSNSSGGGGGSGSNSNNNNQQSSASVSLNISNSATLNIINSDASANNQQQGSSSSQQQQQQQGAKKLNSIVVLEDCQIDDNAPLFYQPGKPNFFSPRQGYPSFERINAFRNVGRLIGLCLLQNELLPIFLQRHVLKYILGRQIRFHDLAFFDPIVYESLRQLVKDSQSKNGAQLLQSLELNFVIDLGPEEGGGSVELVHNGRDIIVNEQNVYDYVRKYAEYRMIKTQEKSLEALRLGVFDVLPETALDSLTAEDLRLLLNGVGDINVSVLSNYTSFNDESNESAEKLQRFKRWLWQIVERMTNLERQDLIYFWTGSPALPASEEGFQPMPTVTIRPADDAHLPTANTCISRLYIPLYSSKAVLRHKLLMAIKTKNFGFV